MSAICSAVQIPLGITEELQTWKTKTPPPYTEHRKIYTKLK